MLTLRSPWILLQMPVAHYISHSLWIITGCSLIDEAINYRSIDPGKGWRAGPYHLFVNSSFDRGGFFGVLYSILFLFVLAMSNTA